MTNTCVDKLQILQNETISQQEIEKMQEIVCKVDELYRGQIMYDDIIPYINDLPKYKINDEDNVMLTYCDSIYRLALYANFINRFEIFKNDDVLYILKQELEREIEFFNPYNENVPEELQKQIKDAVRTGNYINYNLMVQLFSFKYKELLYDFSDKLNDTQKKKEVKIKAISDIKKKLKKLGAKIALYSMLSAPVTAAPFATGLFLGHVLGNHAAPITTCKTNNGEDIRIDDTKHVLFEDAIPSDYKEKTLQYITEFGETIDKKVVVKVYDYTGVEIKGDINTLELDPDRIVFCNTLKSKKLLSQFRDHVLSSRYQVFGIYTGEAHRDISILQTEFDEEIYKNHLYFLGPLFGVLLYGLLTIIVSVARDKASLPMISTLKRLIKEYKETGGLQEQSVKELDGLIKDINRLSEVEFVRLRANNLEEINEKYCSTSEEEFIGSLRR